MNGTESVGKEITRTDIENCIKTLLELSYEELKKGNPSNIGYPTCDLIACFLDAKEEMKSGFFNIFNEVVPKTYKNNWEQFQREKIEPKLDAILESLSNIEDSVEDNVDAFPHPGPISYVGLASMLLMIYGSCEKTWIEEKKEYLVKPTRLLIDGRIKGEGWPYYYEPNEDAQHAQTLSTWLSMATLKYITEEIGNEIADSNWNGELEKIKSEVKNWLMGTKIVENGHCSWSFNPGKSVDHNPVATAQAILALHYTKKNDEEFIDVNCAIEYIKSKKSDMSDGDGLYKTEKLPQRIGRVESNFHAGIQPCLQALLIFDASPNDDVVQNLLKEIIKMVPNLKKDDELDRSFYYATLRPLLLFLPFTRRMVLLDSSASINEFESFMSGAKSIVLLGALDDAHAKLIPNDAQVTVFCRAPYEKTLLDNYGWNYTQIESDRPHALGRTINCVIVDGERALLSGESFRDAGIYNFHKYLKGGEVLILIEQLENIANIEIPINGGDIKQEILDKLGDFPEYRGNIKLGLEKMTSKEHEGILQYFKHNPEYAEAVPATLGFDSREDAEIKLAGHGVISRVFTNGELRGLIKNEIKDKNFVLDESSAYLLANSIKTDTIESLLAPPVEDLYVPIDVHAILGNITLPSSTKQRLQKIGDKDGDPAEIKSERYSLTENEKIAIAFANIRKDNKYGMITNTWEVAKVCMELGINVYSLVKFLNKDEETYKMFRIPIDLLKGV